ncbi:MAG: (Dimethylallyl)adenosine tRNA methylthiotransferase MiaB [Parcubacteria group bacterium GW2011_GWC2_49_9]|nr:MAG: (Dimethylallyl)adenosine tRNA methylthiotransferase MiaB [Parcubacteria group bacterium GW2011_GWA2_48_9]KKW15678.1 MAG: (Dimethylallyl)adenosine tRNA methylthiotransferase MiaB [Parcubacteria group bacterium GW2011_GWC2_49_9]
MQYYLLTIGCQMNKADSERLAAVLECMNFSRTDNEHSADLIGVVACAVRQKAMDRIYGKISAWNAEKKRRPLTTFLTGCVLDYDRKRLAVEFDHFIEMKDLNRLPDILGRTAEVKEALPTDSYLSINPHHTHQYKAYVPIMNGCNSFCTYCAVPYTRGRETSRSPKDIIAEVINLLENGTKEILLIGQIVNKYFVPVDADFDKFLFGVVETYNLPDLPELHTSLFREKRIVNFGTLIAILDALPFDYWIRYTSPHPKWFTDDLIATVARSKKLVPHLHIPVQSGDDGMLRKMLRPYTVEQYKDIVHKMRAAIPGLAVTTDVIVGFCGETDDQYENTKKLFREINYDMAYINQYSPRPGAKASNWEDDVPHDEKERRESELNNVLRQTAFTNNQRQVGKIVRVLVDEYDDAKGENTGKTNTFKTIKFEGPDLAGQFAEVTVASAEAWGLRGNL